MDHAHSLVVDGYAMFINGGENWFVWCESQSTLFHMFIECLFEWNIKSSLLSQEYTPVIYKFYI